MVKGLRTRQDPAWSKASGQDKTQCGQRPEGQTRPSVVRGPERSDRPSEVRAQRARQDRVRSEAQRGQSPREASQTQRGRRPKGLGEHRRCGVALLIHRGVNPGCRDAPGSKPLNPPVLLVVFPGWFRVPGGFGLCP